MWMQMNVWIKSFLIILIAVSIIFQHELAHYVIFQEQGCDNVHFGINWMYAYTQADCLPNVQTDNLNSWNEIIGYNVGFPLGLIAIILILYL